MQFGTTAEDELVPEDFADDTPPSEQGLAQEEEAQGPLHAEEDEIDEWEDGGSDDGAAEELEIGAPDLTNTDEDKKNFGDAVMGSLVDPDFEPGFEDGASHSGEAGPNDHEGLGEIETDEATLPATADDGGAEGIGDGSESELDEDSLPEMDADAGGDFELHDLLDEMGFGTDEPWEVVPELSRGVALAAGATRDGQIVAAGSALVSIAPGTLGMKVRALGEPAFACAALGGHIILATRRGIELVDANLGAAGPCAPIVVVPRPDIVMIAVAGQRLWALAGSTLLKVELTSGAVEAVRDDVLAIAAAQGTLFVASVAQRGMIERLRGDDGAFEGVESAESTRRFLQRGATIAASSSGHLLLLLEGRGLLMRIGGPATLLTLENIVAATFRGQGEATRALLLVDRTGKRELVSATDDGALTTLLALDGPADGAPSSIVWDPTRELAVLATSQGLVGLRPRLKH